jgi:hypothetical protein
MAALKRTPQLADRYNDTYYANINSNPFEQRARHDDRVEQDLDRNRVAVEATRGINKHVLRTPDEHSLSCF